MSLLKLNYDHMVLGCCYLNHSSGIIVINNSYNYDSVISHCLKCVACERHRACIFLDQLCTIVACCTVVETCKFALHLNRKILVESDAKNLIAFRRRCLYVQFVLKVTLKRVGLERQI